MSVPVTRQRSALDPQSRPRWFGYALALVSSLAVIGLKIWLDRLLVDQQAPFLLLFSAVFVTAVFGGTGPGIIASLITGLLGARYFLAREDFAMPAILAQMSIYGLECTGIIVVCAGQRYARSESERLRRDLERRIAEFQAIWNMTPVGIAVAEDARAQRVRRNPALARWLGLASDAPLSTQEQPIVDAAGGASVQEQEMRVTRPDGTGFDLLAYATPLHDEQGRSRGSISTFVDTTAIRRAQAEREADVSFRLAIESAVPAGIAAVAPDGRQTYVNDALCRMVGWSKEEMEGCMPPFPYWPPEQMTFIQEAFDRTLRGDIPPHGFELKLQRRDGTRFDVLIHLSALRDARGESAGWLASVTDISSRREMEVALSQSEERYRSLLAATTAVVWNSNPEGKLAAPEPSWTAYTGQTWSEYLRVGGQEMVHPADREQLERAWQRCLAQRAPLFLDYRIWHAASRQWRWCHARAIPLFTPDGAVREWVGTLTDIDEEKRRDQTRQFLADLHESVLSLNDPDEILREVAQRTGVLLQVSRCHFSDLDLDRDWTLPHEGYAFETPGIFQQEARPSDFAPPELLDTLRRGEPVLVDDTRSHAFASGEFAAGYAAMDVRAFVLVPCLSGGRCVGCLGVDSRTPRRWSAQEIEIVEAVARQTWVRIENARLNRAAQEELEQRRQAERALRERETQFRTLFENSRDAIGVSAGGKILFVNAAMARMLGYESPAAMTGMGTLDIVAMEDRAILAHLSERRSQGQNAPELYEYRGIRRDGTRIHVENHVSTYELDGQLYTLVIARDITSRRAAETALRESEQLLRLIIDASPSLISYIDDEERYRFNNQTYAQWFGGDPERFTGRTIPEIVGTGAADALRPQRLQALTGERVSFERSIVFGDGQTRYLKGDYVPDIDADGRVRGCVFVATDITATKRQEEAQRFLARASEALSASLDYQTILRSVAELIVPTLADWCAIDIAGDDGLLERVADNDIDPARLVHVRELSQRFPLRPDDPGGAYKVLRTGKPSVLNDITDEMLVAAALNDEHLEVLRELAMHASISVPLIARDRTVGVITLVSIESERRYDRDDLQLAQDLAHRVALAVDNARLYDAAQAEIQERERAQEALRLQGLAFENLYDAIVVTDLEARITDCNRAAEHLWGYHRDELLGQTPGLLHAPDQGPLMATIMETILEEGRWEGEVTYVRKDGTRAVCTSSVVPLRDTSGQMIGAVGANKDITAQKAVQTALQETAALLDTLLETAPIGFAFFDLDLRFARANAALARMSGASAEEHQGRTVDELLPWLAPQISGDLARARDTGEIVLGRELEDERAGRHWLVSCYPVWVDPGDEHPQLLGVGAILVDVTEQKRASFEIAALNVRLRQAMTETHHRVKNNLQIISAMIDLQTIDQTEMLPVSDFRRLSQHVRTLAAVHDLLTDQAKRDGEAYTISARSVLDKLLPMVQQMAHHRQLTFEVEDAQLTSHQGTSLALVANEVCSNAIKHGSTSVAIRFWVDGPQAWLSVSDDGPGFPEGFDPLQSANTGLELVLNLTAWDLRGNITFENAPEGGGRVVINFPLLSDARRGAPPLGSLTR